MIGMPIFGLVVDRVGRRALFMLIGSALLVPPFLLMAYTRLPLELSMGMLGLAFAMVPAVLWPAVTYLVPVERLGSAYALMTFCQQAFWAAMVWGMGAVKDATGASAANPAGWLPVMWMLAALATLGFVFSFLLWRSERGPNAPRPGGRAGLTRGRARDAGIHARRTPSRICLPGSERLRLRYRSKIP